MSEGISSPESKDLRDLVQQIEKLASGHHAYSMVYQIVQNCCDHISARARIMELENARRLAMARPDAGAAIDRVAGAASR